MSVLNPSGTSARAAGELLQLISRKELNPRDLDERDKLECIGVLRIQGLAQEVIAQIMHTSDRTVRKYISRLRREYTKRLKDLNRARMAGDLNAYAEGIRQHAIRTGDFELAWQITKELPAALASLGQLALEPDRHEVTHKFDDSADGILSRYRQHTSELLGVN